MNKITNDADLNSRQETGSRVKFDSVLVANRGEIACRVIRTAKSLGYRTIAVYSDADAYAPHTSLADTAINIGAASAAQSYLNSDKIIQAAQAVGAQAIHPGYGFLSENADFAAACAKSGIIFIGPGSEAIDLMGNKAASKRRMLEAGVPCVPGYEGRDQSNETLLARAQEIGVPLMVKAAAGGGGRGMRLVESIGNVEQAIGQARSEAKNAFGSDELILEQAIVNPRHVEVQIFADQYGHTIHLGERDCSVQRRHQKVIEEAPCPVLSPELREEMGGAAVAAAKSINYIGAGTVEFLLDADGQFYFLEMNTRLQVEHPVTELVTGLDLVALQFQVAQGEALNIQQEDIRMHGHAIEVRLYAEDPAQEFLPAAGQVKVWQPAVGDGIRVDDGIAAGQTISPYYDPMVAKVIAWGECREEARRRLRKALDNTALFGITSNKAFLSKCLNKKRFIDGKADTSFIANEFDTDELLPKPPTLSQCLCAAVIDVYRESQIWQKTSISLAAPLMHWASAESLQSQREYEFTNELFRLSIFCQQSTPQHSRFRVLETESGRVSQVNVVSMDETRAKLEIDGETAEFNFYAPQAGEISLDFGDAVIHFQDKIRLSNESANADASGRIVAPMHGQVQSVFVELGQSIQAGENLLVIEAMKMQHTITSSVDGKVVAVHIADGAQVATDDPLVELET